MKQVLDTDDQKAAKVLMGISQGCDTSQNSSHEQNVVSGLTGVIIKETGKTIKSCKKCVIIGNFNTIEESNGCIIEGRNLIINGAIECNIETSHSKILHCEKSFICATSTQISQFKSTNIRGKDLTIFQGMTSNIICETICNILYVDRCNIHGEDLIVYNSKNSIGYSRSIKFVGGSKNCISYNGTILKLLDPVDSNRNQLGSVIVYNKNPVTITRPNSQENTNFSVKKPSRRVRIIPRPIFSNSPMGMINDRINSQIPQELCTNDSEKLVPILPQKVSINNNSSTSTDRKKRKLDIVELKSPDTRAKRMKKHNGDPCSIEVSEEPKLKCNKSMIIDKIVVNGN